MNKLHKIEDLLVQKRMDLQYWNLRTEQVRGTIVVEPVKQNREETELEIEALEELARQLRTTEPI
jgi:hypothetical protein